MEKVLDSLLLPFFERENGIWDFVFAPLRSAPHSNSYNNKAINLTEPCFLRGDKIVCKRRKALVCLMFA